MAQAARTVARLTRKGLWPLSPGLSRARVGAHENANGGTDDAVDVDGAKSRPGSIKGSAEHGRLTELQELDGSQSGIIHRQPSHLSMVSQIARQLTRETFRPCFE